MNINHHTCNYTALSCASCGVALGFERNGVTQPHCLCASCFEKEPDNPPITECFRELRETFGDTFAGVDVDEYMREVRGE